MGKIIENVNTNNTQIHGYDVSKPIYINLQKNGESKRLSPDSNVPWLVSTDKGVMLKPMVLSDFITNQEVNGEKLIQFVTVRSSFGGSKNTTYIYDNGKYVATSPSEFKGKIRQFIPQQLRTIKAVEEIYADLIANSIFIDDSQLNENENIINFKDCIFNIKNKKKYKHSPKIYSTIQLPINYKEVENSNGNCENFKRYLGELVDWNEDVFELILEAIGLCISNIYGYRTKKSIILVGPGNTGKSQIKKLLELGLLGAENCSSADLITINSKFGKVNLHGKRLVGSNDMSYDTIPSLEVFKSATGGDNISIEIKNGGFIDYTFRGFFWFNTNSLPNFGGDKGTWVYERMIPIVCKNVIPENRQDKYLFDKMLAERNAIVKIALEALDRLIARGLKFDCGETIKKSIAEYEESNNTLVSFISQYCIDSSDLNVKTKRSTFFKAYNNYCRIYCNGFGRLSRKTITETLHSRYKEHFRKIGEWYMDNLAILPEAMRDLCLDDGLGYSNQDIIEIKSKQLKLIEENEKKKAKKQKEKAKKIKDVYKVQQAIEQAEQINKQKVETESIFKGNNNDIKDVKAKHKAEHLKDGNSYLAPSLQKILETDEKVTMKDYEDMFGWLSDGFELK